MKNIIYFGPPGAGKGTQARIIAKYLNLPHLSTGDILRSKINQNDELAIIKSLHKVIKHNSLIAG